MPPTGEAQALSPDVPRVPSDPAIPQRLAWVYDALDPDAGADQVELRVFHATGQAPRGASLEAAARYLSEVIGKPTTTTLLHEDRLDGRTAWDQQSMVAARGLLAPGTTVNRSTLVLPTFSVQGDYAPDSNGKAFTFAEFGDPFVFLFLDTVRDNPDYDLLNEAQLGDYEQALIVHEAGHALGLVNYSIPMVEDHEDPDHPFHSINRRSVMWWDVQRLDNVIDILAEEGFIPTTFDQADLADLEAAGEQARAYHAAQRQGQTAAATS